VEQLGQNEKVIIAMKKFIDDFLKLYGNLSTRNYVTPTTMKFCEIDMKAPLLGEKRKKIFHTIVAKLLYLSKRVRLDLLFSVTFLSTRVKSSTEDDWCKLVRIIGHLQATHTFYRVLRRQSNVPRLEHYVDAAFGVHSDGKSHTGSCIFWNDTCLSVSSTKQKMVAKDSTEAELIELSDKLNDVLWMTEFLEGLGEKMKSPILYQDNISCLDLVCDINSGKFRSKHLRARRAAVFEQNAEKNVLLTYCRSEKMIADSSSKPVDGAKHYWCRKAMCIYDNEKND
jgi:hypothetical protein